MTKDNKDKKFLPAKLAGLIIDPVSKSPVMLLKVSETGQIIPIWIGEYEANAITMELEKITPPRPMPHDLLSRMIEALSGRLEWIAIDSLRESTYHAKMHVSTAEGEKIIDCRPSDAMVVALKTHADIYVHASLLAKSSLSEFFSDYLCNRDRLDQWFDAIRLDDRKEDVEH